ncbi:MAG: hypothetical protein AB8B56_06480 [Crocinitomicaceae bacterium]
MYRYYTLAITPNYGKIVLKIVLLFIGMIAPIIFFGIAAANEIINPKEINFAVVFPIYLVTVGVTTYFVIRKTHFKDTVVLTHNSIQIPKLKDIHFDEIEKYKVFTARGIPSYIITLKNGKKIAFGSTDNFSDVATKIFADFTIEFEDKFTKQSES